MLEQVESLAGLRALVVAADMRSFKAAGQVLGISSSAIGKSIARLETQLAVTLFHRTTRSISLTEPGKVFVRRARQILLDLTEAEAEIAELSGVPRGRLRVSLPISGSLLTEALAQFVSSFPQVELDLDYSDRLVDVVEEGFDVVIRTGDARDSRLLHTKLRKFEWRLVASPDYIKRNGLPTVTEDLVNHACLRQKLSSGQLLPWSFSSGQSVQVPVTLVLNVIDPLLDLTRAGAGIAAFPDFICQSFVESGELIPILDDHLNAGGTISMLWPSSRFRVPKVRAFLDCISEHFRSEKRSY